MSAIPQRATTWAYCASTFPAAQTELRHISWFAKFDASDVAILYQNEKSSGEDSTFFKLVQRVR